MPDGENEDDEWVFALGNPFRYAGNDVIDASALFAGLACNATCSNLPRSASPPTAAPATTRSSAARRATTSPAAPATTRSSACAASTTIYGDSGVNVDILTRALTIPTANAGFTSANVDPLLTPGRDTLYGEGAGTIGTAGTGTETGYDDIIFGDHGVVTQLVADPNLPEPAAARRSRRRASSATSPPCGRPSGDDDVIHGNAGRDRIFGGNGNDTITGDGAAEHDLRRPRPHAVRRRHDRRDGAAPGREHRRSRSAAPTTSRRTAATTSSSAARRAT